MFHKWIRNGGCFLQILRGTVDCCKSFGLVLCSKPGGSCCIQFSLSIFSYHHRSPTNTFLVHIPPALLDRARPPRRQPTINMQNPNLRNGSVSQTVASGVGRYYLAKAKAERFPTVPPPHADTFAGQSAKVGGVLKTEY